MSTSLNTMRQTLHIAQWEEWKIKATNYFHHKHLHHCFPFLVPSIQHLEADVINNSLALFSYSKHQVPIIILKGCPESSCWQTILRVSWESNLFAMKTGWVGIGRWQMSTNNTTVKLQLIQHNQLILNNATKSPTFQNNGLNLYVLISEHLKQMF